MCSAKVRCGVLICIGYIYNIQCRGRRAVCVTNGRGKVGRTIHTV